MSRGKCLFLKELLKIPYFARLGEFFFSAKNFHSSALDKRKASGTVQYSIDFVHIFPPLAGLYPILLLCLLWNLPSVFPASSTAIPAFSLLLPAACREFMHNKLLILYLLYSRCSWSVNAYFCSLNIIT